MRTLASSKKPPLCSQFSLSPRRLPDRAHRGGSARAAAGGGPWPELRRATSARGHGLLCAVPDRPDPDRIRFGLLPLASGPCPLVWDRLPIALVCAGLLAAVWAQMALPPGRAGIVTGLLALYAVLSVLWWYWTELNRRGDLRPYLLLQILPILPRDPLSSVALNHLHGLRSGKREPIFFPPRAPAQVP
jgi:hypothetical protein